MDGLRLKGNKISSKMSRSFEWDTKGPKINITHVCNVPYKKSGLDFSSLSLVAKAPTNNLK
jgi:hypothetical protein